jgi:hypothetical protein
MFKQSCHVRARVSVDLPGPLGRRYVSKSNPLAQLYYPVTASQRKAGTASEAGERGKRGGKDWESSLQKMRSLLSLTCTGLAGLCTGAHIIGPGVLGEEPGSKVGVLDAGGGGRRYVEGSHLCGPRERSGEQPTLKRNSLNSLVGKTLSDKRAA